MSDQLLRQETGAPSTGVVPAPYYVEQARYFIGGNKDRFPDLLVEQFARALNNEALELDRSGRMAEMCVVLFRMLKRAGKLKAETDDERALLEVISGRFEYPATIPAGNKRIASPFLSGDEYVQDVAVTVQQALFGEAA